MGNYRLDLCYDGSRYRGWQRLDNPDLTIQGKLEQVISRMLGVETEVIGSGRTPTAAPTPWGRWPISTARRS